MKRKTKTVKSKAKKAKSPSISKVVLELASAVKYLSDKIDSLEQKTQSSLDGSFSKLDNSPPPVALPSQPKTVFGVVPTAKAEPVVKTSKTRFEIWTFDEYNQGSIISSANDLDKVLLAAKKFVTDINVNNALSLAEKEKAWEAYFPVIIKDGQPNLDVLYAGNKRDGKHYVYEKANGKWEMKLAPRNLDVRFYLGEVKQNKSTSDWFLADHKGNLVSSLEDQLLQNKTILFVKII